MLNRDSEIVIWSRSVNCELVNLWYELNPWVRCASGNVTPRLCPLHSKNLAWFPHYDLKLHSGGRNWLMRRFHNAENQFVGFSSNLVYLVRYWKFLGRPNGQLNIILCDNSKNHSWILCNHFTITQTFILNTKIILMSLPTVHQSVQCLEYIRPMITIPSIPSIPTIPSIPSIPSIIGIVSKGVTPHKKNIRKKLKHGADVEDSHDWPCNMPIHWNVTNPSKKELPPTPPFAFSLLRISVFTSSIKYLLFEFNHISQHFISLQHPPNDR